ncbi:MAG: DinB family protein [Deltaproteobacteria bacterium]|nr:DinB family protein [Deltaproteobacteria bacterium]
MSELVQFSGEKAEEIRSKIMAFTAQTPDIVESVAMGLSEEEIHLRPAANQWCMVELVCHLADVDRLVMRERIQLMMEKDRAPIPPLDPDALAEKNKYDQRTFAEAMAEFRNERAESLTIIPQIRLEDWNRVCLHSRFGEVSLGNQIVAWFLHDCSHLRQLLNRRMHLFRGWAGGYETGYVDDLKL